MPDYGNEERLIEAVYQGNSTIVQELIDQGTDINIVDEEGDNLLQIATDRGYIDIVKALLKAGLDVNLRRDETDWTALMSAAAGRHEEIVELLIEAGAAVNLESELSEKGQTALTIALDPAWGESNPRIVKALIDAGADVNVKRGDGWTPFMLALEVENRKVVKALFEAGLDVNFRQDETRWTALMSAAAGRDEEEVKLLIEAGAAVNLQAEEWHKGETALTLAISPNQGEPMPTLVKALIDAGADVNHARDDGWTPLMLAAQVGNEEIVKMLIDAGADINATKNEGLTTALTVAEYWEHDNIIELFEQQGAVKSSSIYEARLKEYWQDIENWLKQNISDLRESTCYPLNIGSTEAEIKELESQLKLRLPEEFKAHLRLYRTDYDSYSKYISDVEEEVNYYNVVGFYEYDGLSIPQIFCTWSRLNKITEQGIFDGAIPHEIEPENYFVKFTWWHKAWIPFAEDSCGNLICIDMTPNQGASKGQVIYWEINGGPTYPASMNFMDFVKHYRDCIVSNKCNYEKDGDYFDFK